MVLALVHSRPDAEPTKAAEDEDVEALVARAIDGDRWALERLYRRHVVDVTRVATYLLGRTADVDDVVQDAFVRAFERLEHLRDRCSFGAWVARIAANKARDRLRRRRFLRAIGLHRSDDGESLEALASPDLSPEQRAELALVGVALRTLPADARTAWTLRHVEGWSLEETAEAIGVSLATVKRRLASAEAHVAARVIGGGRDD